MLTLPIALRSKVNSVGANAPQPCESALRHGMVSGMATRKVTVTLREDQVDEIRALVTAGQASSVSAFVQHAVGVSLADAAGWRQMLEEALDQTGGPLTKKERAWADAILSPPKDRNRARRGKAA